MKIKNIFDLSHIQKKIVDAINKPLTAIDAINYDSQNNSVKNTDIINNNTIINTNKTTNINENKNNNSKEDKKVYQKYFYVEYQTDSERKISRRQKKLTTIIRKNRKISAQRIAKTLNVSLPTIYRDLKHIGIHWVGPSKTGYWELND